MIPPPAPGAPPDRARRRPDRRTHHVPVTRQVRMPRTTSFPSGHAASAFAFATGVTGASRGEIIQTG